MADQQPSKRSRRQPTAQGAWARGFLVVLILATLILHAVVPEDFLVDASTVALVGILVVVILLPLLESATFPGGGGVKFRDKLDRLQDAAEQSLPEVLPPITDDDGPGSPGADGASTSLRADLLEREGESTEALIIEILEQASRSPRAGLVLLSAELERSVRELLFTSGWAEPRAPRTLTEGIDRLVSLGVLTAGAASGLTLFRQVRNEIVHGGRAASEAEILRAIDSGLVLLRSVRAIPRERHVVIHAALPLFSDAAGTVPIEHGTGLLLGSVSPGRATVQRHAFPTMRTSYESGQEVTWEWGARQWGQAWYRDPDTGEVVSGWLGSLEFCGRHLDEL